MNKNIIYILLLLVHVAYSDINSVNELTNILSKRGLEVIYKPYSEVDINSDLYWDECNIIYKRNARGDFSAILLHFTYSSFINQDEMEGVLTFDKKMPIFLKKEAYKLYIDSKMKSRLDDVDIDVSLKESLKELCVNDTSELWKTIAVYEYLIYVFQEKKKLLEDDNIYKFIDNVVFENKHINGLKNTLRETIKKKLQSIKIKNTFEEQLENFLL